MGANGGSTTVPRAKKIIFSKGVSRPLGMLKLVFLGRFEPVVARFGPWKIPKCLENGPFWDQQWVKNGSKTCFSKNDPGPFGMLKQMFLAHFEPVLTEFRPFHHVYAPLCALRTYLRAVWWSHLELGEGCRLEDIMESITWHTRNTWEYTGKKGGFGRKGYVACTGGYECIMHNACIGGLGNTSSLPIVMVNVVFETTPFWALGVYGRILKAPIPQYTAVYSGVYGRILGVYGRILGVFVCTMWLIQVEKFHCCAFCAHPVACFAFAQQLHTT